MRHVFWSDTAKTWEVFAALHNSLKHVQYICILDDIGCICEKWQKLCLRVYVLRNVCIHHVSQLSNANRKFMTSTFTLPLHCLTCPQTIQIQWPEPVLLPLAWSGHFQVQVPLLLRHSQPLPKVLLLFPAAILLNCHRANAHKQKATRKPVRYFSSFAILSLLKVE